MGANSAVGQIKLMIEEVLPKTGIPTVDLLPVVRKILRILGDNFGARDVNNPAQLFLMDLNSEVKVFS